MFLIIKITTMIGLWTRISVLPAIYKRDFETMIDTRFFLAYINFGRTPPPLPCLTTTLPRGQSAPRRTSSQRLIKYKKSAYLPSTSDVFATIFAADHRMMNHLAPSFSLPTGRAHLPQCTRHCALIRLGGMLSVCIAPRQVMKTSASTRTQYN